MSSLELLNAYLNRLEARFRLAALARGAAVVAVAALLATLLIVLATNWLAFSSLSLTAGRIALFLCVAFTLGFGLALPLSKLNRRKAAHETERIVPDFDQRLLTIAEKQSEGEYQPFLELLAANTLELAQNVEPEQVVRRPLLVGFSSAALAAAGTLAWLILGATGFLGHGARLLWAGPPRAGETQAFYDIQISPGNRTVRRGGNQAVTAQLIGFESPSVRLFAKYRDSSKWEEAPMVPREGSRSYEFLFAGLPQTVEYYAAAGRVNSKTFTITVVDVPNVKRMRVTYRYPAWTGLPSSVEDPGGDLRAVEGTEAEVAVETDKPLASGQLVLEDGTQLNLETGSGNWRTARVKIQQDGAYHIAALDRGESVRLTDDYFIEAQKDTPPMVHLVRPGRDAKVLPIEEVPVTVEAGDDFGLRELSLHYSVNGGPEKVVSLLKDKTAKQADGTVLLSLEDYKLVPGDVISLYASANDARNSTKTDMFFVETQPYEREYTQSQQMDGGGGVGGDFSGQQQGQISQRQKEIIAATWNQLRDKRADKKAMTENAQFLSDMQSKLREQAQSLATRMGRRELSTQNEEFKGFSVDMEQAAKDMGDAAGKLKDARFQEAVAPEQQALQHLLRAEATYRQIQVAFGSRGGQRGGGGGGGGQGRDLENLFDLELDTEKNQYETGQQASSGGSSQRAREIDEALQRLEQLARRQQELAANAARQPQQALQQRWQQEMLRREAEELQRQMQQLAQQNSSGEQSSQSGQSQSSQAGRSPSSQSASRGQRGQQGDSRLEQALQRLSDATNDMRRASSAQSGEQPQNQANARRAADRLREAQDMMRGMRSDQADQQVGELARRADHLAAGQQDFQARVRQLFQNPAVTERRAVPQGLPREQLEQSLQLAAEREKMLEELRQLERDMQQASRDLAGGQRAASSKVRSALGNAQQNELDERMKYNAELLRRGYGSYVPSRELPITQGLNDLRDQLREAQGALGGSPAGRNNDQQALAQIEQMRNRLQGLTRGGSQQQQNGQQQGQGGRQGQGGQSASNQPREGQQGGNQGWERNAMNRGDRTFGTLPGQMPRTDPAEVGRVYQDTLRDLARLRQYFSGNPQASQDVQDLIREMSQLDPSRFADNALVLERIRNVVLLNVEQLEVQVRRQLDEQEGGQVRDAGSEPVPPGYSDAVADYFRRLSKGK